MGRFFRSLVRWFVVVSLTEATTSEAEPTVVASLSAAAAAAVAAAAAGAEARDACASLVFGVGLPKSGTRSLEGYFHALDFKTHKAFSVSRPGFEYTFAELLDFATSAEPPNGTSFDNLTRGGRWPNLFTDFPFYALSCQLAVKFPNARFVLVRRDCDAWAVSALSQLFCLWMRHAFRCRNPETLAAPWTRPSDPVERPTHKNIGFDTTKWYFDQFDGTLTEGLCAQSHFVCVTEATNQTVASLHADAFRRLAAVCRAHASSVRECVPADRLVEYDLEDGPGGGQLSDEDLEQGSVARAIGCTADQARAALLQWEAQGKKGATRPDKLIRRAPGFRYS